jgi:hypothetical protein
MVKVGDIEFPKEYFTLKDEDRKELVNRLYDQMFLMVDKMANPAYDRNKILYQIILSSIITNTVEENYEICQILYDIQKLMDEERN